MLTEFAGVLPNLLGMTERRHVRTVDVPGRPVTMRAPDFNPIATVIPLRKAVVTSVTLHVMFLLLLAFAQLGKHQEMQTRDRPHQNVTILYPTNQSRPKPRSSNGHALPRSVRSTAVLSAAFPSVEKSASAVASPGRGKVEVGTLDRLTNNINRSVRNNIRSQVIPGGLDTSRLIHAGVESGATVGPTDVFTPSRLVAKQVSPQRPLEADESARLLSAPAPLYSQEARSLNLTGDVLLEVKLMSSGEVRVLKVLSGLGHGLDQEAVEAVNRTRCLPARRAGRAVDVVATITVVFKLS